MLGVCVRPGAGRLLMKLMLMSATLLPFLSVGLSMKMKVISTDPGASLPAKDGGAELLNSSLGNFPEVTVCARFLTHHFSTHWDSWSSQALISSGGDALLGSYVAKPCEQRERVSSPLSLVEIQRDSALIGPELQSDEIFLGCCYTIYVVP